MGSSSLLAAFTGLKRRATEERKPKSREDISVDTTNVGRETTLKDALSGKKKSMDEKKTRSGESLADEAGHRAPALSPSKSTRLDS